MLRMRIVRLRLSGEFIELTEYLAPKGRPLPVDSRSNDRWFQHIAIIVSDMEHAYAWLRKNKVQHASSGPQRLPEWNLNAGGICGVSAGGFGGTRVIENLLPVMRELGLVTIFWDGNFSNARNLFDAAGRLSDLSYLKRTDKFLKELVWMAKVLRYGREHVPRE